MDAQTIYVWEAKHLIAALERAGRKYHLVTLHRNGEWYEVAPDYNDRMRERLLKPAELEVCRKITWAAPHIALRVISRMRDLYIVMLADKETMQDLIAFIEDTLFVANVQPHTYMLDAKKEMD